MIVYLILLSWFSILISAISASCNGNSTAITPRMTAVRQWKILFTQISGVGGGGWLSFWWWKLTKKIEVLHIFFHIECGKNVGKFPEKINIFSTFFLSSSWHFLAFFSMLLKWKCFRIDVFRVYHERKVATFPIVFFHLSRKMENFHFFSPFYLSFRLSLVSWLFIAFAEFSSSSSAYC